MTIATWAPATPHTRYYPAVTPAVPGLGRRWAHTILTELGVPAALIEIADVIVSELLTNVLRHAPGEAELTLAREDEQIVISCADRGAPVLPPLSDADPLSETGRGLTMIDACASAWWVRRRLGPGKRIIVCLPEKESA